MIGYAAAFLADVVERPLDDTPRLVFADWLDDHGEVERAEFLRLQLARARTGHEQQPSDRERQLSIEREAIWRSELPRLPGVTWGEFTRGFVESAFVESVGVFERHAGAIFASAPILRLQIGEVDADSAWQLMRSSYLLRLQELNLGNNPALESGVVALAESPNVANLTSLLLHNNELGERASVLAESPFLGQLQELFLSGNQLSDPEVAILAFSSTFDRLVELDLRDNQVSDWGVRALSFVRPRQHLSTLWLVNNQIGATGAWALAGTPHLPQLKRLYVNHNELGDEGAGAFAVACSLPSLRELDLRSCGIRDAGGRALVESQALNHVECVWLSGNRFRWHVLNDLRERYGERLRL